MKTDTENRLSMSLESVIQDLDDARIAAAKDNKTYAEINRIRGWVLRLRDKIAKQKAKQQPQDDTDKTCFHCGEPALPKTFGFDPRCEKHQGV